MVKLYYSPLACSLADHIALLESGQAFERERVNLETKHTESGVDYSLITSKGYVPALVLGSGETITENIAILDWIVSQHPRLGIPGALGRTRLLETLAYISTEVHRSFIPLWHAKDAGEKKLASTTITNKLSLLSEIQGSSAYLFGDDPSVADFYLFVMLLWAERFEIQVPPSLCELRNRMRERKAVRAAMTAEGLL